MRFDPYFYTAASFNTDKSKRVMFMLKYEGDHNTDGYNRNNKIMPSLTFRLGNHVYLSGQFDYAWNTDNLQYVGTFNSTSDESMAGMEREPIYLMGHMDQKTYGLTMKLQVNVTPDISIQYYASPFTSTGVFKDFKKAADTKSRTYADRFYAYSPAEITFRENTYMVTTGTEKYAFTNPNFSFNEFRSNLVARWEYLPGSTLYFVWEHRMSNRDTHFISGWGNNLDRMFGLPSVNTFMIKLNYWFSL